MHKAVNSGLTVFAVLVSSPAFAMGRQAPVQLDYSAFTGHFEPVAPCQAEPIDLVSEPTKMMVHISLSGGREYIPFTKINQGKVPFNSCMSDGNIGYTETVGNGAEIRETTVYKSPGIFCSGGFENDRLVRVMRVEKDNLYLSEAWSHSDKPQTCVYIRK